MTLVITHPYVSSVTETTPSGGPGGNVGPSEWNANHTLTGLVSPAQGGTGITSGTGVTFFSSATVIADSGTLTANAVVLGGGANTAPTVVGTVGTTSQILFGGAGGAAPAWGTATSLSSPAGSNTNVQFNNSGVFGGDANFTYTSGGAGVSVKLTSSTSTGLAGISIATSSSSQMQSDAAALKITATWNSSSITYDAPLFMNVVPTLNAAGSRLIDAQLGSTTLLTLASTGLLALANGVSPATIHVLNTVDNPTNPTNYERGVFDWTTTANVLTIGTQAGGTGTVRNLQFLFGATRKGDFGVSIGGQWSFLTLNSAGGFASGNGGLGNSPDASISWNNGGIFQANNVGGFTWVSGSNGTASSPDTGMFRAAAKVVEFSDGASNANGWLNWAGQDRVTANVTSTTTSFADITGMKATLQASRSYSFRAEIIATCSSSGGIQIAASSTTTSAIPTIQLDGYAIDGGNLVRGYSQQTTLNSAIIASTITGTALHAHVYGTVTTTTTGASFKLQVAQQNLSATQTIVLAGSYMLINDTP